MMQSTYAALLHAARDADLPALRLQTQGVVPGASYGYEVLPYVMKTDNAGTTSLRTSRVSLPSFVKGNRR